MPGQVGRVAEHQNPENGGFKCRKQPWNVNDLLPGQPDPHCDVEDHEHKHRRGGRPTRLVERHQLNTVGCRGRHWLSFGGIHARTLARSEQTVRSPLDRDYQVLTKLNVVMTAGHVLRPSELSWDSSLLLQPTPQILRGLARGPNLRPTSLCHRSTSSTARFSLSP